MEKITKMNEGVLFDLAFTLMLNGLIALLFGIFSHKLYTTSKNSKAVIARKIGFYITAFISLFYFLSLPVFVFRALGLPENLNQITAILILLPVEIIIFRKILSRWRNEKNDTKKE
ncbi:MAG: hypothetical protein M1355_00220 [Patescibacteria group bacterium]|nr:hypothetical protein [Patescibacteria group bacterium]